MTGPVSVYIPHSYVQSCTLPCHCDHHTPAGDHVTKRHTKVQMNNVDYSQENRYKDERHNT